MASLVQIDSGREPKSSVRAHRICFHSIGGGNGDEHRFGAGAAGFSDELDGAARGECGDGEAGRGGGFVSGRLDHGRLALGHGRPAHLG